MNLNEWTSQNSPEKDMIFKNGAEKSFEFFDTLGYRFCTKYGNKCDIQIVSYHTSKSIKLPVVQYTDTSGLKVIIRDNFHDIKVTVWSPKVINHDLFGIVKPLSKANNCSCYFEGFQSDWVLGPFYNGCKEFSASFSSQEELIQFSEILKWYLRDEKDRYGAFPNKTAYENYILKETALLGMPCMFSLDSYTGTFRFFKNEDPITPDIEKLRELFTKKLPGRTEIIKYITIDFVQGIPNPKKEWLVTINKVIGERKNDETINRLGNKPGASITILGLSSTQKELISNLGCINLLSCES